MRHRKGQGAMEYLMTYGWAILVVMVVGIAMWRLGIFNMGGATVTSTGFAKIKPQLAGTGLSADGTFTGTFTNGLGTKITVTGVRISEGGGGGILCCSHTGAGGGCANDGITPDFADYGNGLVKVSGGENFPIVIGNCGTGTSGQVYSVLVEIDYNVSIGTQTVDHTDSGTIRGPYE